MNISVPIISEEVDRFVQREYGPRIEMGQQTEIIAQVKRTNANIVELANQCYPGRDVKWKYLLQQIRNSIKISAERYRNQWYLVTPRARSWDGYTFYEYPAVSARQLALTTGTVKKKLSGTKAVLDVTEETLMNVSKALPKLLTDFTAATDTEPTYNNMNEFTVAYVSLPSTTDLFYDNQTLTFNGDCKLTPSMYVVEKDGRYRLKLKFDILRGCETLVSHTVNTNQFQPTNVITSGQPSAKRQRTQQYEGVQCAEIPADQFGETGNKSWIYAFLLSPHDPNHHPCLYVGSTDKENPQARLREHIENLHNPDSALRHRLGLSDQEIHNYKMELVCCELVDRNDVSGKEAELVYKMIRKGHCAKWVRGAQILQPYGEDLSHDQLMAYRHYMNLPYSVNSTYGA